MIIFDKIDDSFLWRYLNLRLRSGWQVGLSQVAIKDVLQQLLNP